MSLYLISYDLVKDKDYAKLFEAIKNISIEYARPLKSLWIIKINQSNAHDIATELCKFLDFDDRLIVNKLDRDSSWTQSLGQATTSWIQENY